VRADGFTLDDKRTPTEGNDLPDALSRWSSLSGPDSPEHDRLRTAQSFLVPKVEIAAQGYDLSLNRYREVEHEEVEHRPPSEILAELVTLEQAIAEATAALARSLSSSK
jgi:type I restriction enzyme M protein